MISIQEKDFDLASEYEWLRREAGDAGAIATFTGLVREFAGVDEPTKGDAEEETEEGVKRDESKTEALFLEHYPGMTEKALDDIVSEANQRWPLLAVRVIHRVGRLTGGEQIVFVGTASSHRQAAFDSARYIMDFLKSRAPFWKKQSSGENSSWVDSRSVDEEALLRWDQASTKPR